MELTCLNCTGTFEEDEARLAASGGTLQCPLCGREQRFQARGARQVPDPSTVDGTGRRDVVSDGFGGAFRKPAAFGSRRPGAPAGRPATPAAAAPAPAEAPPPPPVPPSTGYRLDTSKIPTMPEVVVPPSSAGDAGRARSTTTQSRSATGKVPDGSSTQTPPPVIRQTSQQPAIPEPAVNEWTVKSPTGLVLEFPNSALLLSWSAVVENPAPYQVSRGEDAWMSLDDFLRETKRGIRATQAFRRPVDGRGLVPVMAGDEPPAPQPDSGVAGAAPAAGDPTVPAGPSRPAEGTSSTQRNAVSTTAQFTFKIANAAKPGMPKWAKALIAGLLLLAVGGGAAAFLLLSK